MLSETMATTKTSKRPRSAPKRSLAEIAREAADEAQRTALSAALVECNYSPTAVAEALQVGGGSAGVLRILARLGMLEDYEAKRAELGLKPGRTPTQ